MTTVTTPRVAPSKSADPTIVRIIREFVDNTDMSEITQTMPATTDKPAREERFRFPSLGAVSIDVETAWNDERIATEEAVRRYFETKDAHGFILMPVARVAYDWRDEHYQLTVVFDRARITETRPLPPSVD